MSVAGFVPARGGSQGVPGKNLRLIGGESLVRRAVRIGLESGLDPVLVLTDSEQIKDEGLAAGALVPKLRDAENAGPLAHMYQAYQFGASCLRELGVERSHFLSLLPTNPFRTSPTVAKCRDLLDSGGADWVFTVNGMEHHPYRAVEVDPAGLMRPWTPLSADVFWANRQELPVVHRFNGVVMGGTIAHLDEFSEYPIDGLDTFPTVVRAVETGQLEAFDIDTEFDLEVAQILDSKLT